MYRKFSTNLCILFVHNSIFLGRSASGPIGPPLFHFYLVRVSSKYYFSPQDLHDNRVPIIIDIQAPKLFLLLSCFFPSYSCLGNASKKVISFHHFITAILYQVGIQKIIKLLIFYTRLKNDVFMKNYNRIPHSYCIFWSPY
jgi:hypothetical protein